MFDCLNISLYVSYSVHLVRFGQLLRCADERIGNTRALLRLERTMNLLCN